MRLTDIAQQAIRSAVRAGDLAIDATAGNGHDTLFLAETVGPGGTVWACDLQEGAIAATRRLLDEKGIGTVRLIRGDHGALLDELRKDAAGRVAAIMFNLGYLPGADKSITTTAESTGTALSHALELLRPGGVLTIVAYPGHAAGARESDVVDAFRDRLPTASFATELVVGPPGRNPSPRLSIVRRIGCGG